MMKGLDLYWTSNPNWLRIKEGKVVVSEDAPKEAKESYKRYLKQYKKYTKNERYV